MIIKGVELLQMIADKKIKNETAINRIDDKGVFKYIFKNGNLYFKDTINTITSFFKIREILNQNFEIVENKEEIEKIEEIGTTTRNTLFTMECFTGIPEKAQDWNFNILKEKINELVKAVNKLNEEDTSKETNCMTD